MNLWNLGRRTVSGLSTSSQAHQVTAKEPKDVITHGFKGMLIDINLAEEEANTLAEPGIG